MDSFLGQKSCHAPCYVLIRNIEYNISDARIPIRDPNYPLSRQPSGHDISYPYQCNVGRAIRPARGVRKIRIKDTRLS